MSDFHAYYHLDLVDSLRPESGFSPRRALALIRQLPPQSATVAAIRGGSQFRGWGLDQYFYAALIDAVRENTYAVVAANSKKKPKLPEPVPRPDDQKQSQPKNNQFAAMAGARIAATRHAKGG